MNDWSVGCFAIFPKLLDVIVKFFGVLLLID